MQPDQFLFFIRLRGTVISPAQLYRAEELSPAAVALARRFAEPVRVLRCSDLEVSPESKPKSNDPA